MIYAHLDGEKLLGWYDDTINTTIPTPNIPVSKEVHRAAQRLGANAYVNGQFVTKDFLTDEEKLAGEIEQMKIWLQETDYKDLPTYDKRDTPEWNELMAQRQAWREAIRNFENR